MKMPGDEPQFQQWFSELRRADEQLAPPFEQVLKAARARAATTPVSWGRLAGLAAVAMLCLLSGIALRQTLWPHRLASQETLSDRSFYHAPALDLPWQSSVLVSEWHSPTDFLLEASLDPWRKPLATTGDTLDDLEASSPAKIN